MLYDSSVDVNGALWAGCVSCWLLYFVFAKSQSPTTKVASLQLFQIVFSETSQFFFYNNFEQINMMYVMWFMVVFFL